MTTETAFVPPQAVDLEKAVLGAAMLEAPALRTLLTLFVVDDVFYQPAHRYIFRAIRTLNHAGLAVDMMTVVQQLRSDGVLERVGGPAYVAEMTLKLGSGANVESHCRILQQHHARRVIIDAGRLFQRHGYDESKDPLELLAEAQQRINTLHQSLDGKAVQSAAGLFPQLVDSMLAAVQRKGMTGVPTGLTELNDATGGWQPGDLIILAGRPGMGKTAALLHFARTATLDEGIPSIIFSMEMPALQLMQRLLSSEVDGYSNQDIRRGNFPGGADEVQHVAQKAKRLGAAHGLLIDDTPGLGIGQLRAKCARLKAERDIGMVFVDYAQLMHGKSGGNREQEIGSITRGLKEMAKELNVPVIALSQLSRAVETRGGDKRPQLSDLRESGSIEQDADMIVFLWRGEYYNIESYADGSPTLDTVLIDIAKHRNGATGEVIAACNMRRFVFGDLYVAPPVTPTPATKLPDSRFEDETPPF